MIKIIGVAVAGAVALAPAVVGLAGNPSLRQQVPVQNVQQRDDSRSVQPVRSGGREAEPGDDRGGAAEPGDDRGGAAEPGDDRGGAAEPGDDRGGADDPAGQH
jgi:hypothetical protein